ncbi:aromatic ring-hydroxylating dioxygenase subunit alpha [cf. Phormidesmis sp. LEGE 11477]|uniref:aromatic ring-hydroxylating dioxygenase subunit alpha n=1 Tax=cf. Phormidesmis sp. LEGE 11477 TaxID=1828680 RepID=UPI001881EE5E|nr:aromatic ring-hydroxylating dioxygenase subunit alpha [cf. Phormidesmis sp. LEGE 11477]MBE9060623.1 aromatic ring-hydroxylating dioxygenase subunit alpha [cf. Phormidesmis sp. LEGE 11477]
MLKNFWYACEFSSAIVHKPKSIKMLGQNFVLYRDRQEQIVALKDQCPHRGAALSLGWVEDNCIRCPYHGWKFRSDGQCTDIPANGPAGSLPPKAQVATYPVQEKYGFIWIFYGDLPEARRPPIPPLPEYDDPSFHSISVSVKFNAHYTRVIENALCPAHMATVHANSFGAGFAEDPRVAPYQVESRPWGLSAKLQYANYTKPKGIFKLFFRPSRTTLNARTTFYMPNITIVESDFVRGKMVNYAIHLPVDDTTTISKRMQFRNVFIQRWMQRWIDPLFVKFHYKVCEEDRAVSESQYPPVIPDSFSEEVHTPADALPLAYRKLRQQCIALGWGTKPSSQPAQITDRLNDQLEVAVTDQLVVDAKAGSSI